MIEEHVRMAREIGRDIATPEQARQMLKIGVTYNSIEETLANLGLPRTANLAIRASWCTNQTGSSGKPSLRVRTDTYSRSSDR